MMLTLRKFSSRMAAFALALICISSFALMFYASRTDSAIDDELAHIPAGYGYVHNFAYRLNPEHPPLIKALAILPVLFLNPTFPTNSKAWTTEVNGEWDMGTQFLYESGNNANAIIQTARIMPMLVTILTIILIYLLACGLMGEWWALLPAFLFAMDPNILGNGHYVTTDVGAAFGFVLALYYFLKYIERPSKKHLWYAGLSFGVAQLTKFSTPLLIPLFIFLVLVLWVRDMAIEWHTTAQRSKIFFARLCRALWKLILIGLIGYVLVVYPVYFLFTVHYPIQKQVSDTQAILTSFANGPTPAGKLCSGVRCLADTDIWMSKSPVLRPYAEYMLGILMVLQRTDGGNAIYFLGEVRGTGGWIYFPFLFLLKEPIPTLIIVFLGLILALWWMVKKAVAARGHIKRYIVDYLGVNFAEFSMASLVVFYWGYSIHSPLNLGIRYVLPTFPFIYILAAGVWKRWITQISFPRVSSLGGITRSLLSAALKYIFLIALVFWLLLETLFVAPYFLSYFNEFGGGVWNGYHYAADSNYDWGQDLLRLQTWMNAHPEVNKIAVDYFGGGNPKYYLGDKEVNWVSTDGNPADQGIQWFAVSVNQLEVDDQPLAPGQIRNPSSTFAWLWVMRPPAPGMGNVPTPDYRIGTTIFVYHL